LRSFTCSYIIFMLRFFSSRRLNGGQRQVSRGGRILRGAGCGWTTPARASAPNVRAHFQNRATQTPANPTFGKLPGRKRVGSEAGNARRALGRGTYVSEKDFLVFLCRLETAMRAASCGGAGWGRSEPVGRRRERLEKATSGLTTWNPEKPKFFRAKQTRTRRARGGFDVPARSRGAWRSSTRRSPRRARRARSW
jgi:hypothetical protein